ncbi:MAG: tol-pal system YbgF family protein [Polyangiales bacterium]
MKLFLLSALALSFFVVPPAAGAQEDEAREEFRAGIAAVRADDWEVARGHFERAYELAPRASVLANLAAAQRQTGMLVEAKASYEEWLRDPPRGPLRRQVRAELQELEPLVPSINVLVRGAQPGDTLLIDGNVAMPNEDIEVNPGWREVEVERGDRVVASLRVNIDEGDHEEVQLTVRAVPSAAETGSRSDAVGSPTIRFDERPDEVEEDEEEGGSLTWLWVTLGVVAVGAAAGVTAAVLLGGPEDPFIGNAPPGWALIR